MTDAVATHRWIAPWSSRSTIRLVLIAEVENLGKGAMAAAGRPIAEVLNFGRLSPHVLRNREFLPYCLASHEVDPADVKWDRVANRLDTRRATGSVWAVPGSRANFYVQLVDVVPHDGIADLVAALEDMYYADLSFLDHAADLGVHRIDGGRTHQLVVFSEPSERELTGDEIQRLIYRADLEARNEYSSICRPDELNRRPGRGAALGPFVSVLWGQQDYIENCAFLSILAAAAAAVVIVDARRVLMAEFAKSARVAVPNLSRRRPPDIEVTRRRLASLNNVLADTENRIAISIDGFATIMPYVPALRVESYHRALFEALDTEFNRCALERLLARLAELVRVEQEVLAARMAREAEARNKRWTLSVGIASVLTIPFGIIFGFFGVAAAEIDPHESMFATRYWPIFGLVLGATCGIATLHYILYRRHQRVSWTADSANPAPASSEDQSKVPAAPKA